MSCKSIITLIISLSGFTVSFIFNFNELIKVLILCVSSYIIFVNYPIITKSLASPPLFITDIQNSRFEEFYINIMNFILSLFLGCAIYYWLFLKVLLNKPYLEISAIIGGNISFILTVQNYLGKILLSIFHKCKLIEDARSRRNSEEINTELTENSENSEILSPSSLALTIYNKNRTGSNPVFIA